jgi:hypothetical protein
MMISATSNAMSAGFTSLSEPSFSDFGKASFSTAIPSLGNSGGRISPAALSFEPALKTSPALPELPAATPGALLAQRGAAFSAPGATRADFSPAAFATGLSQTSPALVAQAWTAPEPTVPMMIQGETIEFQGETLKITPGEAWDIVLSEAGERLQNSPWGPEGSFVLVMQNSETGEFAVDGAYNSREVSELTPTYQFGPEWNQFAVLSGDQNGDRPGLFD